MPPMTKNQEQGKKEENATATTAVPRALFVFPSAAGHVNPSLPLCERLASSAHGWKVDYLCIDAFREKIEKTGAIFHDRNDVLRRRFGGNDDPDNFDATKMIYDTLAEYNEDGNGNDGGGGSNSSSSDKGLMWGLNFGSITTERLLPAYIDFFGELSPLRLVVYCPVLCLVAKLAATRLGVPAVSLLTAAGPGWVDAAFASAYGGGGNGPGQAEAEAAVDAAKRGMIAEIRSNRPNQAAIEKIRSLMEPVLGDNNNSNKKLAINLNTSDSEPLINEYYASANIVTTVRSLSDPLSEEDARFYDDAGKTFYYVGPLLMQPKQKQQEEQQQRQQQQRRNNENDEMIANIFRAVESAVSDGRRRKIVYVSMGTVITSRGDPDNGWNGRTAGPNRSLLTGKQLCHSVYRAVFAELGAVTTGTGSWANANNSDDEEEENKNPAPSPPSPLIVVSVGSEPDAIEGIDVPDNAICASSVPQVDLLRSASPALAAFVTNGGQNSFTEGLSAGVPLLVCPGFGDQLANAARAASLGVGTKVDRPMKKKKQPTTTMPVGGDEDGNDDDEEGNRAGAEAAAEYEGEVSAALRELLLAEEEIDDDDRSRGAATAGEKKKNSYSAKAREVADELRAAGGVDEAVRIILSVAAP